MPIPTFFLNLLASNIIVLYTCARKEEARLIFTMYVEKLDCQGAFFRFKIRFEPAESKLRCNDSTCSLAGWLSSTQCDACKYKMVPVMVSVNTTKNLICKHNEGSTSEDKGILPLHCNREKMYFRFTSE